MITQEMIDDNRDVHIYEGWWEHCVEDAIGRLRKQGIEVTDIYFRLAYSQGDGACFDYAVVGDEELFFREHFSRAQYPWVAKLLDDGLSFNFQCKHGNSNYYHSNCVWFSMDVDKFGHHVHDQHDELECEVADIWDEQLDAELDSFQDDCEAIFKGYMDDIYTALQEEYEYLTSDEAVKEYLEQMEEVA